MKPTLVFALRHLHYAETETPVLWPPLAKSWLIGKDPDAGRDWGQEEKWNDRGWDGWMASPTRGAWVWVNSGSWWWTGRPGVLRFMGWQRVGHDWATELNWTEPTLYSTDSTEFVATYCTVSFPSETVKSHFNFCTCIVGFMHSDAQLDFSPCLISFPLTLYYLTILASFGIFIFSLIHAWNLRAWAL